MKKSYILWGALLLTFVVLVLRAAWIEVALLRVTDHTVTLEKLPPEQDGMVIAVLGDMHFRRAGFESGLYDAVTAAVRERKPDLVLLLGDFLSHRDLRTLLETDNMSRVVSKWHGKFGTLAIPGNHDLYRERSGNWRLLREALEKAGAAVLDGTGIVMDVRGKPFQIVGVGDRDDSWFRMGEIPETFDKSLPVFGMIHDPEDLYSIRNRYDMIFSAHTHRGQLRMPVFGERYLQLRFRGGWFGSGIRKHLGCTQFVTSGIGTSSWPLRLHNLPEAAFVTLRSAPVR